MSEWDCEHGNSHDLCPVCFRERIKELEAILPTPEALEVFAVSKANHRGDMPFDERLIPNEWLLRERASSERIVAELEERIEKLEALQKTGKELANHATAAFVRHQQEIELKELQDLSWLASSFPVFCSASNVSVKNLRQAEKRIKELEALPNSELKTLRYWANKYHDQARRTLGES